MSAAQELRAEPEGETARADRTRRVDSLEAITLRWLRAGTPCSRTFPAPSTVTIGRAHGCDIVVQDEQVSRRHCTIVLDRAGAVLTDLGSANGTYVNGRRAPRHELHQGDQLRIGRVEVEVELDEGTVVAPRGVETGSLRSPSVRLAQGDVVQIAGYTFGRCLGQGAFGAVFEASTASGQRVAIKVLKIGPSVGEDDRKRFLREAATASVLQHPNAVRVLDHGVAGPVLYLVMEFVPGETVQALVDRTGPLTVARALEITRGVASALEAARAANVVHRDVKPENILLAEGGVVKLVDFGLAKSVLTAGKSGLTREGDIVGTAGYMAPEQLESSVYADHRSDIYSLGATLFHMLTGRMPFVTFSYTDLYRMILREPPPRIADLRPGVPPVVTALVDRCLRKAPSERHQTAGEIVRLLDVLLRRGDESGTVAAGVS